MTKIYNSRHMRYVTVEFTRYDSWRNGPNCGAKQFATLEEAVRWVGEDVLKLKAGCLTVYKEVVWGYGERRWTQRVAGDAYLFRDDSGLIIPVWKVQEVWKNLPWIEDYERRRWLYHRYSPYDTERHFRKGPMPGIHRKRWNRGSIDRHVATTQERRENDFADNYDEDCAEYGIGIRRSRSCRALPTWWDDIPRRRRGESWKHYRDTRWKKGAVSYRTLPLDEDE